MGRGYLTVKISSGNKKFYSVEEKVVLKKVMPHSVERNFEKNFLKLFGIILGVGIIHFPFLNSLMGTLDTSWFSINRFYLG